MSFKAVVNPLLLLGLLWTASAVSWAQQAWPRQVASGNETLLLNSAPKRIVSTSVTLTGTLLSLNAPVIGTGTGLANRRLTDDQGFFLQWSAVAQQQQLQSLYHGEINLEMVASQRPDLIVVSATGNDSALPQLAQLKKIAPVLVINYTDKSWQQVATELGNALGLEAQAQQRIAEFDKRVANVKQQLRLPPQPVSAMVWNGVGRQVNLWTAASAQGELLQQLGFQLAPVPERLTTGKQLGRRTDIVQLSGESLITGITGKSWLLFASDDTMLRAIQQDPLLKSSVAVTTHQLYAMGNESFRLDYYSANRLLTRLQQLFGASD